MYEENKLQFAGVRTFITGKTSTTDYSGQDRRTNRRWNCSEDFLPTGTAPNPVRYNDFILFRVEDISAGGMRIITSMRNKFVGIGQRLESNISLPYVGTIQAKFQVKHVHTVAINNKDFLILGVHFIKTDPILMKNLGEYLLNFAKDISVKSLNKEGFGIKTVSKWLDFSYVKTEEEYKEVLNLRYLTYKANGKIRDNITPNDMSDEFDAKGRILIAKHEGKIVGSVRATFPKEGEITDHGRLINYPKNFPKVDEIVEVSRLCVDNTFRGADITYSLIAHLVLLIIQGERRYMYTAAARNLIDFYKKCGLKRSGITYESTFLNNVQHELILMDTYSVALGKDISPKYWNKIFSNLIDYIIEQKLIEPTVVDLFRIKIYKVIGGFLA